METRPRLHIDFEQYQGAHAQRLDHYQIFAPDTYELCEFYSELGFRNSEYLAHGDKLLGAFMYRKGTCLDLAIVEGDGPAPAPLRLHRLREPRHLHRLRLRRASTATATRVERGPGRHGPGGMLFVYLRDPDGHRVEVFNSHYQTIDIEIEPVRWDAASLSTNARWGLPALEQWYFEASPFVGRRHARLPAEPQSPMTLERFLLEQPARPTTLKPRRHHGHESPISPRRRRPEATSPLCDRLEAERKVPTANIFRALTNAPALLDAFLSYANALRDAPTSSPKLRELAILTVGHATGRRTRSRTTSRTG